MPISPSLQGLQAALGDPRMPGGEGSTQALKAAIDALQSGDAMRADALLGAFQTDARRSSDFTASHPGGSGDDYFTKLRASLHRNTAGWAT